MIDLVGPETVDKLYDDRGSVPLSVPLMQGDVLDKVFVPGLMEEPDAVMIAAHPCSMRRGSRLAERIAVVPVTETTKISDKTWKTYLNGMLLPDLRLDGSSFKADFRQVASVRSNELARDQRIATLSVDGLLILQQRTICFWTRFKAPLNDLGQLAAPITTEIELQQDWVEAALAANNGTSEMEVVVQAEEEFHDWLDENDRERRKNLQETRQHASLRRGLRSELKTRYPRA